MPSSGRGPPTWTEDVDPSTSGSSGGRRYEPNGELLGEGGLGRVDAVLDRDLGREVARKQLIADSPAHRERFLREARVTAQLEHPGIVPVYELAVSEDGKPFYTMRRIRGRTLGAELRERTDLAGRIGLLEPFASVCQAVAYAHARGVVHRDLKPENIMIGEFGETLVVDWGLAKLMTDATVETSPAGAAPDDVPANASLTRVGATLGTPAYMSPEQARGEVVDARTDVWGLGQILLELLSGRPPFDDVPGGQVLARLCRGELEDVPGTLVGAPPDLVAIVSKALAPAREARYPDAGALATDLQRWRSGGLVAAYRYSLREVLSKTAARHRGLLLAVLGVALTISAVVVISFVGVSAERDRAVAAEAVARGRLARSLAESGLAALEDGDAMSAWVLALGSLDLEESSGARGTLLAAASEPLPVLLGAERASGTCALPALSAGASLACWTQGGVRVWDTFPGPSHVVEVPRGMSRDAWRLVWAPGSERLAAVHRDGTAWQWRRGDATMSQVELPSLATAGFLDDTHLIAATEDGRIGVIDLTRATAEPVWSARRAVVRFDAIEPLSDGTVLVGSVVDPVRRWAPATDTWTELVEAGVAPMIASSADGAVRAEGGGWGGAATPVRVFDAAGVRELARPGSLVAMAMSADGRRVAAAGARDVMVWDGPDWTLRARIPCDSPVLGMALARDGRSLAVGEWDGDVRMWQLPAAARRPRDGGGTMWDVRATADGSLVASAGNDGVLRTWDPVTGNLREAFTVDDSGLGFFAVLGRDVIISTNVRGIVRVSLDDGAVRWTLPLAGLVNDVEPIGDGVLIALSEGDVVRLAGDGALVWRRTLGSWVVSAFEAPDGSVVAGVDSHVVTLDPSTGAERSRFPVPELTDLAMPLPDGTILAGSVDEAVRYGVDGSVLGRIRGHEGRVRALAAGPTLLATAADDGRICLWADEQALACWPAHGSPVWKVAFGPGTERLVSAGADGAARMWDLRHLDAPVGASLDEARARFGLRPGDGQVVEEPASTSSP